MKYSPADIRYCAPLTLYFILIYDRACDLCDGFGTLLHQVLLPLLLA